MEATQNAEISGAQRASRNATHKIAQLDEEAQRQKELVLSRLSKWISTLDSNIRIVTVCYESAVL